jgi:hypothetical protein
MFHRVVDLKKLAAAAAGRVTIEISGEIFAGLKKKLEGSSFNSVSELAEFILQEFLDMEEQNSNVSLSDQENRELHERLRKLGYE